MATIIGQEQIATAPEPDIRIRAIHTHLCGKAGEEIQPVLSHQDILRQAEQLANAAIRIRRCGKLVGRVRFDNRDGPGPGPCQKIRDGRSDDAAANDRYVTSHGLSFG